MLERQFDFTCPACKRTEIRFMTIEAIHYRALDGREATRHHVRCLACNNSITWSDEKLRAFVSDNGMLEWGYAADAYTEYLLQLKGS